MKNWFKEKILNDNKKTLLFISLCVFSILFIYQICVFAYGTYFNSSSDDVLQYSPILGQYIELFKSGKLSLFNYSNNLGASIFADMYYLPIDIFSLFTLIFSLFCDKIIAFSIVELLKVLFGVTTFAFLLQKCKYKNWIVATLSFVYFCVGGSWVLAVFPTYFSLFFYLPCSLLVVKYYCEGKKWLLPLYGMLLILYNFYNAYSLFIFMGLDFIVVSIRDNYKDIKSLAKDVLVFCAHIILSVFMGMVILLPSVLYILNYSPRDITNLEILFDFNIYFKMISKMFVYETGTLNFIDGVGDLSAYVQNHFSYYIGLIGIFVLSLLFYLKDRTSRIYKWTLGVVGVFAIFPIFSSIFTGVATAYLRWLCFLNVILLCFVAHILEQGAWEKVSAKQKIKSLVGIGALYLIAFVYNMIVLVNAETFKPKNFYYISMLLVVLVFAAMYFIFYLSKQKNLFCTMILVEFVVILVINLSVPFGSVKGLNNVKAYRNINEVLNKLDIEDNSLDRAYIGETAKYNNGRFGSKLTNEVTFHSFNNTSVYDYQNLYNQYDRVYLIINNLRSYSPLYTRANNYKYVMITKELYDFTLDYMDVYYEDDYYIVYENKDYEPFYVYENYYVYDEVESLNYKKDYIEFQKKLFKGVVLEEGEYNLNYQDFNYDDSSTKYIYYENNLALEKQGDSIVGDLGDLNFQHKGFLYFEFNKEVEDVKIVENDIEKSCLYDEGFYKCKYDSSPEKILVDSSNEDIEVMYHIVWDIDEDLYLVYNVEDEFNSKYISYFVSDNEGGITLIDSNNNERRCLVGFCSVDGFDAKYVITGASEESVIKEKDTYIRYQEGFDYYYENKNDLYAQNKELFYDGSTVTVRYERISSSEKDQVIVLPLAYSDEWVCDKEGYTLVKANGGYLGIMVESGITSIDVSIKFKTSGLNVGIVCSFIGIGIYVAYVIVFWKKKKKENFSELNGDKE